MHWSEIIKEATFRAFEAHARLNSEKSWIDAKSVDIFSIIEHENIILMFQPLGNLAGAYIPSQGKGAPSGILINGNLPIAKQRYSAAHEYCHYLRGDDMSTDTEEEMFDIKSYKRSDSERIAETFAANFLMPRPLVKSVLMKMGADIRNLMAEDVYTLALRLGTSYQATVNQLFALKMISQQVKDFLTKIKPKQIKEKLGSDGLDTSWNDVWVLNEKNENEWIQPRPGDVISIQLHENPGSGYIWGFKENQLLRFLNKKWLPFDANVGSLGYRLLSFQTIDAGTTCLEMQHCRPWSQNDVIKSIKFNVEIQTKRQGISERLLVG
jgi:Zn-dependent peptidase ImmA (M78 family)